ncbi:MAG: MBL fold metallo-hydrolase, partial [Leeuwenhoekiella sp.]
KYVNMLERIKTNVEEVITNGKTKDEIIAMESLTSNFYTDEEAKDSFINGPKIRETLYDSLKSAE